MILLITQGLCARFVLVARKYFCRRKEITPGGIEHETKLMVAQGERIVDVIINEAKSNSADLIIIGTHGRTGFSRILLGSVAEGVVRTTHIPTLLIRGG